ncbi:MAG: hypothetical protein AAF566_03445 [Pseudomonadota bacterium]
MNEQKATSFERIIEPSLLDVRPTDPLGLVLQINTLRRAFARLLAQFSVDEPDWDACIDQLIARGPLAASALVSPREQPGYLMLRDIVPRQDRAVERVYGRAFHGEVAAHMDAYFEYFLISKVPEVLLEAVSARCQHEELLRMLETALGTVTPDDRRELLTVRADARTALGR